MNMGEPVVGWIEPRAMRKAAMSQLQSMVLLVLAVLVIIRLLMTEDGLAKNAPWLFVALACVSLLLAVLRGALAWFFWSTVKEGWGALQAIDDGDALILGTAFGMRSE